jgi:hypothetical protein
MRRIMTLVASSVAAVALVATAGGAAADPAVEHTSADIHWHAQVDPTRQQVDGAIATLRTTASGARVQFRTLGLHPGHAYTLWFVVINEPQACADHPAPCRPPDVFAPGNPTSAQVVGVAGNVVGASGRATFSAHVPTGDIDGWLPDQGLTNPLGAEVHLVLNDHGPKLASHMPGMIKTYRGGCSDDSPFPAIFPASALMDGLPGPNICLLAQDAVFQQH